MEPIAAGIKAHDDAEAALLKYMQEYEPVKAAAFAKQAAQMKAQQAAAALLAKGQDASAAGAEYARKSMEFFMAKLEYKNKIKEGQGSKARLDDIAAKLKQLPGFGVRV